MKVLDPGHRYELGTTGEGKTATTLQFIKKEKDAETGELKLVDDGVTTEEVLAAVLDRLQTLDKVVPSEFNTIAIDGVSRALEALEALETRTKNRVNRGVEGTAKA